MVQYVPVYAGSACKLLYVYCITETAWNVNLGTSNHLPLAMNAGLALRFMQANAMGSTFPMFNNQQHRKGLLGNAGLRGWPFGSARV